MKHWSSNLRFCQNDISYNCLPVVGIVVGCSVVYSKMNCNDVLSQKWTIEILKNSNGYKYKNHISYIRYLLLHKAHKFSDKNHETNPCICITSFTPPCINLLTPSIIPVTASVYHCASYSSRMVQMFSRGFHWILQL